jgi:hypothetical protein
MASDLKKALTEAEASLKPLIKSVMHAWLSASQQIPWKRCQEDNLAAL